MSPPSLLIFPHLLFYNDTKSTLGTNSSLTRFWKAECVPDALESCANQHQIEMKFGGARQSMSLGISTIGHLQHLQPSSHLQPFC
jgi:hypothetical protein